MSMNKSDSDHLLVATGISKSFGRRLRQGPCRQYPFAPLDAQTLYPGHRPAGRTPGVRHSGGGGNGPCIRTALRSGPIGSGCLGGRELKLLESRRLLTLLLAGVFLWSLSTVDWRGPIIHTGGLAAFLDFLASLFPPELSPGFLGLALSASWQTLAHAVARITLAVLIGFPLGVIASGSVSGSIRTGLGLAVAVRLILAAMRSIHELVWAVLFVAAFGLSSLTVILALALPYSGILGRIYGELFSQVPEGPLRALRASGASPSGCFCTDGCQWPCQICWATPFTAWSAPSGRRRS